MKFLDIRTDFAFKKVFGSEGSKDILLSFLNAVIDFNGRSVCDLTIVDPYNIPMLKGMKDTFVDVKAQLSDGSRVIIEMQVLNHEGFEQRVLYNAAKNYSLQLQQGQPFTLLNPVIALTLADFVLFPDQPLTNCFKLLEKKRFIEYSDDIELVFIELPKFNKTEADLETVQDKWLYFIKNAGKLDYVPKNLGQEQEKAFAIANESNLSTEELELQHRKRDYITIMRGAFELALKQGQEQGLKQGMEKGIEEGMEKGMEKGVEQNRRDTIINAHRAGVPPATIAQIVQLDVAEVCAVLAQLGQQ
ncbi:Rpn family recombination-promoting nuclease/putative transposase [Methylovulum miyakonense]|uniref:Rpn family recombination-promoting nuclease/putative transposase n=1 Tax=Methylovulum miyakonense TaxID=645578 RepID=UPI00037F39E5|nr:Rpn family recombination-promoting nuclease/putative transposase [Methylovulum miyakonense]